MAKINRKYIDKHWLVFLFRGALATIFSCFMLFSGITEIGNIITIVSVFLLFMGIVDTVGALYSSTKKHGWLNAVIDALVDVIAALVLLLFTKDNLIYSLIVVAIYVIVSGLIDIFHGFLSTVDPTDRFIRVLIGAVIINSGDFEMTTFIRFFGAYMLLVGASSLIYGVHNRAQNIEDKVARKEARKHAKRKK